jgi:hypothetical protein
MAFSWLEKAYRYANPIYGYAKNQSDNQRDTAGRIQSLEEKLMELFGGELKRTDAYSGPIESAFLEQTLKPNYDAAKTAAEGKASELFRPGGEIQSLIAGARGASAKAGFDPASSIGQENSVLRAGMRQVGDTFAQGAAGLEQTRFQALSGAYGDLGAGRRDLMESLFSGLAGLEQAKQSNRKKFLGIF